MLYILTGIFIFFTLMDQLSKQIAVEALISEGNVMEFIPGLIRFEYRKNTGMAWGILPNARVYFIIVTLLLSGILIYLFVRYWAHMPKLTKVSLALILAGGAGNLIDRVFLGYVRDFIAFDFFDFPVFNIADCCVSIGAVLLLVTLILTKGGRNFIKFLDESDRAKNNKK